ncbi:MAG: DUF423 domain-containing protein, partial [Enterobacteriaceae bacterium]
MSRFIILFAAISGFVYVALGSIGAHLLAGQLEGRGMQWWLTGLQYQGLHTVALLFLGLAARRTGSRYWNWSAGLMMAGIILFSGSLYGLALTLEKQLSYLTPIGGVCFLLGWSALFCGAMM